MYVDITFSCGHTRPVSITGKSDEKQRKTEWLQTQKCWECQCAEKAQNAKEISNQYSLPELVGSEKQITWAEQIRSDKYLRILNVFKDFEEKCNGIEDTIEKSKCMDKLNLHKMSVDYWIGINTNAHFWIENRFDTPMECVKKALKAYNNRIPIDDVDDTEYIICPDDPVEKYVFEIYVKNNDVCIVSVTNDDFRKLVKSYGFKWDYNDHVWKRTITVTNGTVEDRTAEIGSVLLKNGFIIKIKDKELRDKTIAGDFEPETKLWIVKKANISKAVIIKIPFGNDELFKAAKSINGARWISGVGMSVPVSSYQEITEFMITNGYKITSAAQTEIEKGRAYYENIIKNKTHKY